MLTDLFPLWSDGRTPPLSVVEAKVAAGRSRLTSLSHPHFVPLPSLGGYLDTRHEYPLGPRTVKPVVNLRAGSAGPLVRGVVVSLNWIPIGDTVLAYLQAHPNLDTSVLTGHAVLIGNHVGSIERIQTDVVPLPTYHDQPKGDAVVLVKLLTSTEYHRASQCRLVHYEWPPHTADGPHLRRLIARLREAYFYELFGPDLTCFRPLSASKKKVPPAWTTTLKEHAPFPILYNAHGPLPPPIDGRWDCRFTVQQADQRATRPPVGTWKDGDEDDNGMTVNIPSWRVTVPSGPIAMTRSSPPDGVHPLLPSALADAFSSTSSIGTSNATDTDTEPAVTTTALARHLDKLLAPDTRPFQVPVPVPPLDEATVPPNVPWYQWPFLRTVPLHRWCVMHHSSLTPAAALWSRRLVESARHHGVSYRALVLLSVPDDGDWVRTYRECVAAAQRPLPPQLVVTMKGLADDAVDVGGCLGANIDEGVEELRHYLQTTEPSVVLRAQSTPTNLALQTPTVGRLPNLQSSTDLALVQWGLGGAPWGVVPAEGVPLMAVGMYVSDGRVAVVSCVDRACTRWHSSCVDDDCIAVGDALVAAAQRYHHYTGRVPTLIIFSEGLPLPRHTVTVKGPSVWVSVHPNSFSVATDAIGSMVDLPPGPPGSLQWGVVSKLHSDRAAAVTVYSVVARHSAALGPTALQTVAHAQCCAAPPNWGYATAPGVLLLAQRLHEWWMEREAPAPLPRALCETLFYL